MRPFATASLIALTFAGLAGTADRSHAAAPGAGAAQAVRIPTQLPTNVRPLQYTIAARPDAEKLRFSGRVDIDIQVLQATDSITLNAADLDFDKVSLGGSGAPLALNPRKIDVDAGKQTATFRFARKIAPGNYRLTINYGGKIYTQAAGLFALDYEGDGGKKRALFTQ
ncbi:MAG TPA: M1 family peptidase, partial [Allosphingosinicella sp.]